MGSATIWKPNGFGGGSGGGEDLLENLIAMGILLDRDNPPSGEDSVPQILQILETSKEEYVGTLSENYKPDFGFYGPGETVPLNIASNTTSAVRVKEIHVQVKGVGANTLIVHGDSWTVTERSGNDEEGSQRYIRLKYVPTAGGVMNLPMLRAAIDELTFEGDGETPVNATITLSATLHSGATVNATGQASFQIVYDSTWKLTGMMYPTFGAAADSGKTWAQLNVFDKSLAKENGYTGREDYDE